MRYDARKRLPPRPPFPKHVEARYRLQLRRRAERVQAPYIKALNAAIKRNAALLDAWADLTPAERRGDSAEAGLHLDAERDPVVLRGQIKRFTTSLGGLMATARRKAAKVAVGSVGVISKQLDLFATAQVFRLVQKVARINPFAKIAPAVLSKWNKANVGLIVTVDKRYFGRIEAAVVDAVRRGTRAKALSKIVDGRVRGTPGMSHLFDANRIARDQVGKLHAQITQTRLGEAGVQRFVWSTSGDERVREEHVELDGKTFEVGVGDSEEGVPGEPINCRCVAIPVLGSVDKGEQSPELQKETA